MKNQGVIMEINFDILCPHCSVVFPKKIDNIELKDTKQLIGIKCPNCAFVITKDDVSMIDRIQQQARDKFENNVIDPLFTHSHFK